MCDVTLPEAIFTEPMATPYRRGYRAARLVVHQNIMRQARATTTLRMRLCAWALNWNRSVNQIKAIYAQMAADGLCTWEIEGEGHRDDFATFTWSAPYLPSLPAPQPDAVDLAAIEQSAYKAGYEAGRRSKNRDARTETEETTTEPHTFHTAPTEEPHRNHATHTGAQPVTGTVTGQPESVLLKTPEPVTGQAEPDSRTQEIPRFLVEEFVRLGMEPEKAQERLHEFGPERCQDALDTLAYRQESKQVPRPVGFLVDFLVQKRTTPTAVLRRREKALRVKAPPASPAPPVRERAEPCQVKPPADLRERLRERRHDVSDAY